MDLGKVALVALVLLAGCADPPPADPGPEAARESRIPDAAPFPDPQDIAWDGALPAVACVPSGLNQCSGIETSAASGKEAALFIEAGAAAWTGRLTATWQAASPTSTLELWVGFYSDCGFGCWESTGATQVATGGSPLAVDLVALEAPEHAKGLYLAVREPRLTPDPLYAQASPGVEFRVEGRLEPSAVPTPSA
jgi:hypothetical protein